MRVSRRALCAGTAVGLVGLVGCQAADDAEDDVLRSPAVPELPERARPDRPSPLDRDGLADYVERYERALAVRAAADLDAPGDPSEAVSIDCDVAVRALAAERYVCVARCSGTIRSDPDGSIEFPSEPETAPLYLVTPNATRRIVPGGGSDEGNAVPPPRRTYLTAVNLDESVRTITTRVPAEDGVPPRTHRIAARSAYIVGLPDAASGSLSVTASVDGGDDVERTISKEPDDAVGVYVVADGDGPPVVAALSPILHGEFASAPGSSPSADLPRDPSPNP